MAEFGEGERKSWDSSWGDAPSSGESKAKPKPEHDSDTNDTVSTDSEPADRVRSRQLGGVVTGPDRPTWD